MMLPGIEQDLLGSLGVITVDPAIYSENAIFKAAYWFTDKHYVFLERADSGAIKIELRNKPGSNADLATTCSEFCNSLVDFRVREIVNNETSGIRETLIKRAFLEGVPASGLTGAISDETHLTSRQSEKL
jgi:His-Xaa-Ser system protein HxsD